MWLQYVSPVLLSARDLELAIPGTYLRDGQQHAVPRESESLCLPSFIFLPSACVALSSCVADGCIPAGVCLQ